MYDKVINLWVYKNAEYDDKSTNIILKYRR